MHQTPPSRADQIRAQCRACIDFLDRVDGFRPLIEEAMRTGSVTHTYDDIVDLLMKGELVARFYGDAFFIVCLHEFPRAKHYHIFLAGGKLEALLAAKEDLLRDARDAGCQRMTINGRPGWARIFRDIGATHAHTMLVMEVPQDGP